MKTSLTLLLSILALLLISPVQVNAQLSDLHFLPPLKQKGTLSTIDGHKIYLTTPSTDTMMVDIYIGTNTNPSWSQQISKTSGYTFDPGSSPNVANNDITLLSNEKTGIKQSASGLRFQSRSGERFYVTYRVKAGTAQASSLTSKGRAALGTSFKWVGSPNRGDKITELDNAVGIMATENGTTVEIFGYNPNCTFRKGADAAGFTEDNISITLDRGQTFVLEAPIEVANNVNADGWIGANIQSNKNIVVSVSQLHYIPIIGSIARDLAMDQIVPTTAIGKEYVFIRGKGTNETEFPVIIGTENDTKIYVNGSSTADATINDGDFYQVSPTKYLPYTSATTSSPGSNMFVTTSKPVYALQSLAGDANIATVDLNFIAPVNCLMGNSVDYIPNITDAGGMTITGAINIVTSSAVSPANLTIRNGTGANTLVSASTISTAQKSVTGTSDWKTYFIPNLTGDVSISANGPIAVAFFGFNDQAGASGYYSGFESLPTIEVTRTGDGCMNNTTLTATAGFTSYSWFKDGVQIAGVTSNTYTPTSAGSYNVNVYNGTCSFTSSAQSIYDCTPEVVVRTTADKSGILANETVNLKTYVKYYGLSNATNMVATVTVPSNITITGSSASFGTITNSGTTYTWTIGTMRNAEEHILTITGTGKTYVTNTPGTMTASTTHTDAASESNKIADDFNETITVYSAAPAEPAAQPTNLYFTNTGDAEPYNNVLNFSPSASDSGYLVVRRKSNAPDLTPVDGTVYTAGETSGSNYILYVGTDTTITDLLVSNNTDYHYAVFAYSGAGSVTNYLTTSPLSGFINTRNTNSHSVGQSSQPTSVGMPGTGVNISFSSIAAGGTTLNATKVPNIPTNHTLGLPAGILGVAPVHYTVTSTNAAPGTYSIVLDYSSLGYTSTQWADFKILKRSNSSSNWTDITANLASTSVDGIIGKIRLSGLTSFSDFAIGSTTGTLPVTWGTFSAKQQQNDVLLQWSTLTESNADRFQLQHATDQNQWQSIGQVTASGFSNTEKKYSLLHTKPGIGTHLYRIQQVDRDGKYSFSPIARIKMHLPDEELRILGNPVSNGTLVIQLSATQSVRLLNTNGVIVLNQPLKAGLNTLDISHLPKGIYFLSAGRNSRQISIL